MSNKILAWHFLRNDGCLNYPPHTKVEVGQKLVFDGEPKLCECGYHASERLIDALKYAPGPIVCRVEVGGTIVHDNDKLVATERTAVWMQDISSLLHHFACDVAEQVLEARRAAGQEPHKDSWNAIKVKRDWLAGCATDSELAAARAAAWAAWAELDAWDALDAWHAAGEASKAVAWGAQNTELEKRVFALMKEPA